MNAEIISLLITVQVLSATGALAPGPLFVVNLIYGSHDGWQAGLKIAIGHTLVEFPLFIMIGLGLISLLQLGHIGLALGVLGGTIMIIFGVLQVYDSLKSSKKNPNGEMASGFPRKFSGRSPLFMGIALSAFNPFFILWWLLIGSTFIYTGLTIFSYIGLPLLYISHVWMDYAWLTLTAHLAYVGKNVLKEKRYNLFVMFLGVVLIIFGVHFVVKTLFGIPIIPL